MTARIDRLWPDPADDLDDEALLAGYAPPAWSWLRMNFIASLDGAATRAGRSGGLGDAADARVFDLLRWGADAIVVGAGTIRDEGYGAVRLPPPAVAWRVAHGYPAQPTFALLSRALDLDPAADVLAAAPVRPIVYTVADAPPERRAALERVADVVSAGEAGAPGVDVRRVRADLAARGLSRLHAEGGPSAFGAFLAADAVDELCLTLAPSLQAGRAGRIATSAGEVPTGMALRQVLRAGDELLLRYVRRG